MKLHIAAFLLTLQLAPAAQAFEHSQARLPGEHFEDARARYLSGKEKFPVGSAEDVAVPLSQLDLKLARSWDSLGSYAAVTRVFERVRDVRFLVSSDPAFLRRITWLYPDDGCFARAATADLEFVGLKIPLPTKVFAFGELGVKTPNSPLGAVGWWYHVVPAISFKGTVYVLDPSVEPKRPLTLTEWLGLISESDDVKVAICAPGAYSPGSNCDDPNPNDNSVGPKDEKFYLKAEWNRIKSLKRDPVQELGDHPPW
jgi:hypothetical protein